MKTALMQYLGVIVPHCTVFFSVPINTGAAHGNFVEIIPTDNWKLLFFVNPLRLIA